MNRLLCVTLLLACTGCVSGGPTRTSTPAPVPGPEGGRREALTRRLDRSAPGAVHARLEPLVGTWDVRVLGLAGGAEEVVASGTAELTPCLGGRFVEWRTRMDLEGRAVHARGLLGFDSETEEYQFLWASELGTGMRLARGRGGGLEAGIVLRTSIAAPRTVLRRERAGFVIEQYVRGPDGVERPDVRTEYRPPAPESP